MALAEPKKQPIDKRVVQVLVRKIEMKQTTFEEAMEALPSDYINAIATELTLRQKRKIENSIKKARREKEAAHEADLWFKLHETRSKLKYLRTVQSNIQRPSDEAVMDRLSLQKSLGVPLPELQANPTPTLDAAIDLAEEDVRNARKTFNKARGGAPKQNRKRRPNYFAMIKKSLMRSA